jgi:hypothetical protein
MGNWYRVTKRINGRLYVYLQRTYRVGKSVKTENKYIGPATATPVSAPTYERYVCFGGLTLLEQLHQESGQALRR